MASFLFVMWEGGGNVNPFLGLAEGLLARGHRVQAVASASLGPRLASAGIDLLQPVGWLPTAAEVVAAGREPPDATVVDFMAASGLSGAKALGRPTVALVHTLYMDLLQDGAPWPMTFMTDLDAINRERSELGLAGIDRIGGLLDETDLLLVTVPRQLDGPGELPPKVHYGGCLFESAGPDAGWTPPAGDAPLVVASMGTAGQGGVGALQRVLDAMTGLDIRGFVTIPPYVDRAELHVPEHVTVTGYVRHAAVLPHADLMVTHAGLGSVTAALAFGVPMICVPEDREQPANAAAVERLRAGQALPADASVSMLRQAMETGLASPRPEPCAPDSRAVDLVEGLAL